MVLTPDLHENKAVSDALCLGMTYKWGMCLQCDPSAAGAHWHPTREKFVSYWFSHAPLRASPAGTASTSSEILSLFMVECMEREKNSL